MEDKHSKPLRQSSNKLKDIYNTYIKNDENRNNITHNENMNESSEKELEEKIEAALNNQNKDNIKENNKEYKKDNINMENSNSEFEEVDFSENHQEDISSENKNETHKYEELLIEAQKEKDSLKDLLVRKTAEMENLRRRTIKEKDDLIHFGNERLLSKFIEIPDDLLNALEAIKKTNDKDSVITGMEMIYNKVNKLFIESGVTLIGDPVGKPFDVEFQEALMTSPSEYPEGIVTQVLQNGYMLNGKVIRHSKVITSSGN